MFSSSFSGANASSALQFLFSRPLFFTRSHVTISFSFWCCSLNFLLIFILFRAFCVYSSEHCLFFFSFSVFYVELFLHDETHSNDHLMLFPSIQNINVDAFSELTTPSKKKIRVSHLIITCVFNFFRSCCLIPHLACISSLFICS